MYERIKSVYKDSEVGEFLKRGASFTYRGFIRKGMPIMGYEEMNGVKIGGWDIRLGDKILPSWLTPFHIGNTDSRYEDSLIEAIDQNVRKGDKVVVIGGGYGVTSVKIGKKIGPSGNLVIFEASRDMVEKIVSTMRINNIQCNYNVNESIVEKNISVRGNKERNEINRVKASSLPECDVVEMDCEGAEIEILKNMEIRPRNILVESHGMYGASTDKVISKLNDIGYEVMSVNPADGRDHGFCVENDIKVVSSRRVHDNE